MDQENPNANHDRKPNKKDLIIMAALIFVIVVVVDFDQMSFLDIAIVVLGLAWIAMTVFKWLKRQ